jgi:hypothetical protein
VKASPGWIGCIIFLFQHNSDYTAYIIPIPTLLYQVKIYSNHNSFALGRFMRVSSKCAPLGTSSRPGFVLDYAATCSLPYTQGTGAQVQSGNTSSLERHFGEPGEERQGLKYNR